jgi:hypothetical protein
MKRSLWLYLEKEMHCVLTRPRVCVSAAGDVIKCDSQNTKVMLISLQVTEELFSGGSAFAECAKQVAIQYQVGDGVWRMSRFYLGASS